MLLVSGDDGTNQLMAYHIALVEIDNGYSRDVFQRLESFHNSGAFVRRQIDLGHVAGDHALRAGPDAGQ